jgi:hypothetical protein
VSITKKGIEVAFFVVVPVLEVHLRVSLMVWVGFFKLTLALGQNLAHRPRDI